METWQIVSLIFGAVWTAGFLSIIGHLEPSGPWYKKALGWIMIFFIWPYIAMAMNTDI